MTESNPYWSKVDAINSRQFVRGRVLKQLVAGLSDRTLLQSCQHYQTGHVTKLVLRADGSEYMLLAWPEHRLYTNVIDSEHLLGPSTATTNWHIRAVTGSIMVTKYFAMEPETPKPSNVWRSREMFEWTGVEEQADGHAVAGPQKILYAYSVFELGAERDTFLQGTAIRSLACIGPAAWTVQEQLQSDGVRLSMDLTRYTVERRVQSAIHLYEPFVTGQQVREHVLAWCDALAAWQA